MADLPTPAKTSAGSSPPRRITDIAAESVLIAAGGRAILLQLTNPAVARGVAEHSGFASRPLDRLVNTMRYVYSVVYGDDEQIAAAVRSVARAHAPVRRPASESDPGYSAFDPQLQLWVAATLYHSAIDMHERINGPLDALSAEQIYRDYAVLGTALQVPDDAWPPDRRAFEAYWQQQLAAMRIDSTSRSVAEALLHPRSGPLWLRAAMPTARLVTAGLLPPTVRNAYGMPWPPARRRRFERLMAITRVVYPRLPRVLRQLPRDRAVRQAKG